MDGTDRHELEVIAREAMRANGLEPDFPPQARQQIARLSTAAPNGMRDLRSLPWSSIDNDESRDLDQLEVLVEDGRSRARVLVAIADVDALVPRDSPVDAHAATNTARRPSARRDGKRVEKQMAFCEFTIPNMVSCGTSSK